MSTAKSDQVSLEVTMDTSVEKVWDAWTKPERLQWFGSDPNGKLISATLDVREGGYFEITFRDSNQTEHTCSGIYKEVDKFRKLSFSWTWKSEPNVETFVIIEFIPEGDSTRIQFVHANLGTASAHNYLSGWRTTFLKLERMLTSR